MLIKKSIIRLVKNIFLPFSGCFDISAEIAVGREKLLNVIKKTNIGFTNEYMLTASIPTDLDKMILLHMEMIFVTIPMNIMFIKHTSDDFLCILSPLLLKCFQFRCIVLKQLCIYLYLYK